MRGGWDRWVSLATISHVMLWREKQASRRAASFLRPDSLIGRFGPPSAKHDPLFFTFLSNLEDRIPFEEYVNAYGGQVEECVAHHRKEASSSFGSVSSESLSPKVIEAQTSCADYAILKQSNVKIRE